MDSRLKFYLLLLSFIPIGLVSLLIGRYPLKFDDMGMFIILHLRLPRILLVALTGAVLSSSGAALQATLRNPLVSPYILGVTQGAAFGAALAVLCFPESKYSTIVCALIFGTLAITISLLLSRVRGSFSTITVILSGIIVGAVFSALLSIVKYVADPYRLQEIVFWTMGGFYKSSWENLLIATPGAVLGMMLLFLMRWRLNVLSMGDEEARLLGVNVKREKILIIFASSLACASVISVSGIIAFIGLIVPHMVRALIGPDVRYLIPASMSLGAGVLIIADDLCRSLFSFEIPISIITTLIAAPYFVYLLRKIGGEWK